MRNGVTWHIPVTLVSDRDACAVPSDCPDTWLGPTTSLARGPDRAAARGRVLVRHGGGVTVGGSGGEPQRPPVQRCWPGRERRDDGHEVHRDRRQHDHEEREDQLDHHRDPAMLSGPLPARERHVHHPLHQPRHVGQAVQRLGQRLAHTRSRASSLSRTTSTPRRPARQPVTAATVNQCVGSGKGGGGTVNCSPYPASTTGATVTQCNGSANGGGATADCHVATQSRSARRSRSGSTSATAPETRAGARCRTSLTTNILGRDQSRRHRPQRRSHGASRGGVQAGDGTSAGLVDLRLLTLGGSLLVAASGGVLLRRRLLQGAGRFLR